MAGLIFRAKFVIFLSTLSLRRATSAPAIKSCWSSYFYPRSPCGERPKSANTLPAVTLFLSTLSLRRATYTAICLAPPILFLSTLSLRRATGRGPHSPLVWQISIHALLAESDIYCHLSGASYSISIHALLAESDGPWSTLPIGMANFYPRSPCGERLVVDGHRVHITRFLSTLSLRRATIILRYSVSLSVFSIHALLAESDQ